VSDFAQIRKGRAPRTLPMRVVARLLFVAAALVGICLLVIAQLRPSPGTGPFTHTHIVRPPAVSESPFMYVYTPRCSQARVGARDSVQDARTGAAAMARWGAALWGAIFRPSSCA
jgi:hypothetical protein